MAGRPRTMAKRLTDFESKVVELLQALDELMPELYRKHESPNSDPAYLWTNAVDTLSDAGSSVDSLARFYREKAGITGDGPFINWDYNRLCATCDDYNSTPPPPAEPISPEYLI